KGIGGAERHTRVHARQIAQRLALEPRAGLGVERAGERFTRAASGAVAIRDAGRLDSRAGYAVRRAGGDRVEEEQCRDAARGPPAAHGFVGPAAGRTASSTRAATCSTPRPSVGTRIAATSA